MEYENARKGIKRIYAAEICALIAVVLSIVVTAIQLVTTGEGFPANGTIELEAASPVMLGMMVAMFVLVILSLILHFLGITKAGKDEPKFRSALLWVVVGIILSSLRESLKLSEMVQTVLFMGTNISEMLVKYFVIRGVMAVAENTNRPGLKSIGSRAATLAVLAHGAGILLNAVVIYTGLKTGNPADAGALPTEAILLLASSVLSVIAYVVYLRFLKKAVQSLG